MLGSLAAWLGAEEILAQPPSSLLPPSRAFTAALLFETFVFAPIGAYLQHFHLAWSWMYFVPPSRLDTATSEIAVLLYVLSLLLGYALGVGLARHGSPRAPLHLFFALGTIETIFSALTTRRLLTVATFDEYHRGEGRLLIRDFFGIEMALIVVFFSAGLWVFYRFASKRPARA